MFAASNLQLLSPRRLHFLIWSAIKDLSGEITTAVGFSTTLRSFTNSTASWKIRVFPCPVGRTAYVSLHLEKWISACFCSFESLLIPSGSRDLEKTSIKLFRMLYSRTPPSTPFSFTLACGLVKHRSPKR